MNSKAEKVISLALRMVIASTINSPKKRHVNVPNDHVDDDNIDEGAGLEELK
jgi:hypothetical protein